jgi:hypothetical protein
VAALTFASGVVVAVRMYESSPTTFIQRSSNT